MDILTIRHKDFTLSIECSKWEGAWDMVALNIGVDNLTSTYSWSDGVESVVLKTSEAEKCLLNGKENVGVFWKMQSCFILVLQISMIRLIAKDTINISDALLLDNNPRAILSEKLQMERHIS